jgi:hypothetical protein
VPALSSSSERELPGPGPRLRSSAAGSGSSLVSEAPSGWPSGARRCSCHGLPGPASASPGLARGLLSCSPFTMFSMDLSSPVALAATPGAAGLGEPVGGLGGGERGLRVPRLPGVTVSKAEPWEGAWGGRA